MTSTSPTPTVREMVGEVFSLVCVMAVYGPPVVFVAAPWLGLGLMLSGPFAVVITLVLAATVLVAGIAALVAAPYLIVRGLRIARASIGGVPVPLRRVTA